VFRPEAILSGVIDATGERDLSIVAHSFGAWAALKMLDGVSDTRIRTLTMTAAGSCDAHRPADVFLRKLRRDGHFEGTDPFLAALAKSALGQAASNTAALRSVLGALTRTAPSSLATRSAWMREAKATMTYAETRVPVSVLAGDRDTIEPFQSQVRLAESIGSRLFTVRGFGHLACVTHPAELARSIARLDQETEMAVPLRRVGSE
jgi:pimeloyl-ACP methyl ester carboxylesterase